MTYRAADVQRMLAQNAALTARSAVHAGKIRAAAAEELDRVNQRLGSLTEAAALTDEVKAHEYRQLVMDRRRLLALTGG